MGHSLLAQNIGNDVCPSSDPCPASLAIRTDNTTINFSPMDTVLGNTYPHRDTLLFHSGVLYKFNVIAGNAYSWNTSPNYSSSITTNIDTKITLYYDDMRTPIIAQSAGTGLQDLSAVIWRASYTGVVYMMITREESYIDTLNNGCGVLSHYDNSHNFVGDSILCAISIMQMKPNNVELVWGRYNPQDIRGCDFIIYDSGLADGEGGIRNCYGNNENGYIVIYPDDPTARLKFSELSLLVL